MSGVGFEQQLVLVALLSAVQTLVVIDLLVSGDRVASKISAASDSVLFLSLVPGRANFCHGEVNATWLPLLSATEAAKLLWWPQATGNSSSTRLDFCLSRDDQPT